MGAHMAQELLNELGSALENLETRQAALLRFLKDQGIVTDEQLAPYLNEAGNASSVRWRAAHVRLEHLFSAAAEKEQPTAKSEDHPSSGTQTPPNEQKDRQETGKPDKSRMGAARGDKTPTKEEKAESAEPKPQASEGEAKAHEAGQERREQDAA